MNVVTAWVCPVCDYTITEKPISEDKISAHLSTHRRCVECMTQLEFDEAPPEASGKFAGLCDACTRLKLGLQ